VTILTPEQVAAMTRREVSGSDLLDIAIAYNALHAERDALRAAVAEWAEAKAAAKRAEPFTASEDDAEDRLICAEDALRALAQPHARPTAEAEQEP